MGLYGNAWVFVRPDAVYVWNDKEVVKRVKWYYEVMVNKKPAKFLIAKYIDAEENPKNLETAELWKLHEKLSMKFKEIHSEIKEEGGKEQTYKDYLKELGEKPKYSYLDVKIELVKRIIKECHLCEWRCGIDRHSGKKGICKLGLKSYVSSYFLHVGEEAPLVPSGTIFYGSCNFCCVFCQNHDISQENPFSGIEVGPKEIALIQKQLRDEGARNINHVGGEPTPNLHNILESLKYLDINVPQLWNSNMYLSKESLKLLLDIIDIWLPDFKYGNNECAKRLSGIPKYFDIVSRNHKIVCENRDPIIIRHLVLPNHVDCDTKPILSWIYTNCPHALVNIMSQYRPEYLVLRFPEKFKDISRRPNSKEMKEAYRYARELGLVFEPVS